MPKLRVFEMLAVHTNPALLFDRADGLSYTVGTPRSHDNSPDDTSELLYIVEFGQASGIAPRIATWRLENNATDCRENGILEGDRVIQ